MSPRILVVEDEPDIAAIVVDYLRHAGYTVEHQAEGRAALASLITTPPDLTLLDIMLPGMDGLEILRQARRHTQHPIIMLTARVEEVDRLIGLELGADDYICKPFSPREVVARVKAVLRRTAAAQEPPAHHTTTAALLLDEPAAGLRHLEKQALADLLRQLRAEGLGILVVEHDMEFVMNLADRITVLEFGTVIAEGSPAEIQSNQRVLDAYLGGADEEDAA